MKFLIGIWALVMFGLACIPCTDGSPAPATEMQQLQAAQHQEDHNHDIELCSPLCECNCCGGIFLLSAIQAELQPQPHPATPAYISYLSSDAAAPAFPYWHPPKI